MDTFNSNKMRQHFFYKHLITFVLALVSLCSIQAFAFDTNLNLALAKPATARDTWSGDGGIYTASKTVDGSLSTSWMAAVDAGGNGSWLYVDLQNYYMVNKVVIAWSNNRWPSGAWKLQVATNDPDASGNANWVDVYSGNAGSDVVAGTGTYTFTATTARYVRMLGATQATSYGYHILEMSVFGSDYATPTDPANSFGVSPTSKTLMTSQSYQFQSVIFAENGVPMNVSYAPIWSVSPSSGASIDANSGLFTPTQTGTYTINCNTSYNSTAFNASATVTVIPFDVNANLAANKTATTSGQTASNGNDGNLNTRWRSNNANQQEWWQVDLGADYAINNVTIKMNGDAGARNATYNILVSLTGLDGSWQSVVSTAQIPAGSGTEYNSHTFATVPARYVKYDGITRGGWDHNFAEFEVHGIGYYHAPASSAEFSSILFSNSNVIANEEVALTISAIDADNNPYLNANISGVEITVGNAAGVTLEKRSNVWYARGISVGTYTLTATGVVNGNSSIVKTGTATLTVTEARRVATINMSTPFAITKYATNRAIDITLSCIDQYGDAITPTIVWDIQGTAGGSVSNNKYTPANKGTGIVKATSTTTAGLVESQAFTFDVVTNAANIALNKPVTAIATATTAGSNAVDGNEGSQWVVPNGTDSNGNYDAWLVIDLQQKYFIELIEVIWEGAFSKTFTVDYSDDGVNFTTKYNGTNPDGVIAKDNKFYLNPSNARYVRIYSTKAGSIYGTKILEVYVHGKSTTITTNSNNSLSTSEYTTEQLANSDLIISSNEMIVDQNTSINSITVNPGAKLTLNQGQSLITPSLTLNSDATGTATFVDNGTATISTANVLQHLTAGRNWYISSPITAATSGALSSATSVVSYNEPTAAWITENASTLNPLKGYIAVTPQASSAITFTGTLNTGNKSITVTRTPNVAKSGFNLVGNPYPSYLNWDLAYAASTNLQSSVWFRTKTVETSSVYTFDTYNAVDGVGTNNNLAASVTKYIPPMQAFWVRVAEGQTSGTMRMNNTMRTHRDISTNKFRAPAHADQQLIRLLVSNGVNKDEAIVLFNPNASDGFDEFDSQKMSNANAVIPEIYTTIGDQQLVINGLSTMTTDTELPLGFNTLQSNTFSIKASEISNFSSDVQIILKDKLLNTKTDLAGGAEYTFASDAINTTSRFSLLFRVPSVTTGLSNTENQPITIFRNQDNCISVNVSGNIGTDCYVSIYNALGQRLTTEKITTSKTVLKPQSGAGVYVVKVQNQGKDIIAKVTLN